MAIASIILRPVLEIERWRGERGGQTRKVCDAVGTVVISTDPVAARMRTGPLGSWLEPVCATSTRAAP